ncbi:MAG TPA: HAD-IA family hydrolase [Bacillota bacterium]|jgi:phosphoglycolate phosphatase|nr:HAD-IA family hydrolase [Bacillota bacterium]HOL09160.1 HAD-IA family hydrolase [Bacillota bacterium]HPO96835.1 HAD-IA family hydrolase [Bacillota bacterium]
MYKCVLFDFDGTIADSKDVFIEAYNQMADKHNLQRIEFDQLDELRRLPLAERLKILNLPLYKVPVLAPELYKLYKELSVKINIFDGIKELLQQLKEKGLKLAIISSNSEHNIREVLMQHRIDLIDAILCSTHIFGKAKMIKKFLKTHRLSNSEVIYVGDELRDIHSCKQAQIKVIWVEWGYDIAKVALQGAPDYVVSEPQQILSIV